MSIKGRILSDEKMREIGFTDYVKDRWYYSKTIRFPKEKIYKGFHITFNVTIPKDGSNIQIDILDEDFLQPYDYQYILQNNPIFDPCLIVKEQVEEMMIYMQEQGVISGYTKGDYI